ncbi:hypothetical protein TWF281_006306 [Arthrobotrys megalospora]
MAQSLQRIICGLLAVTLCHVAPGLAWAPQITQAVLGPNNVVTNVYVAPTAAGGAMYTYPVYTMQPMPTLVYNCAKMPSICKNVRNYLGGQTIAAFHYDREGTRNKSRRQINCPGNWMNTHPCPEVDQPVYYIGSSPAQSTSVTMSVSYSEITVIPGQSTITTAITDAKRLASIVPPINVGGGAQPLPVYEAIPLIMSCDEFPPASFIEGGLNGATYCAPIMKHCDGQSRADVGPLAKSRSEWGTEQDWQAAAHGSLNVKKLLITFH